MSKISKEALIVLGVIILILSLLVYAAGTPGVSHVADEITPGNFSSGIVDVFTFPGKVGIGITSPPQKLSVAGVIESTTGGFKFPDGSVQTVAASGTGNNINGNLIVSGNVGIGTGATAPVGKLHIKSRDDSWGGGIRLEDDITTNHYDFIFDNQFRIGYNDNTKLVMDTNGNVGIGAVTPGAKLEVIGGSNIGIIARSDIVNNYAGIFYGNTHGLYATGTGYGVVGQSAQYGGLFQNLANTANYCYIGAPSNSLICNGDVSINGKITFTGQKICSVITGGNWRDTLFVPSTWTAATCNQFRIDSGSAIYVLGCIFANSYSIGGAGGGIPPSNCGW